MKPNRADGMETRRKLLDAAVALFAEKGFRETKTADICRIAEANVAAVNYHFGSKEALYVAAWRDAFEKSLAKYPPDGGVAPDAPAEQRLVGHVRSLVHRFLDPASLDMEIADREMTQPTGLLAEIMHRSIEPLRLRHLALIREYLGPRATDLEVQLGEMSTHAQCHLALLQKRRRRMPAPRRHPAGPPHLDIDGDTLANHVSRFCLAGIREMRKTAGSTRRRNPGRP